MNETRPWEGKKKRSPSAIARDFAEQDGFLCETVERWVIGANIRKDLIGCIDIVLIDTTGCLQGVLGVQVTSMSNVAARVNKAKKECAAKLKIWLRAGNRFQVWGIRSISKQPIAGHKPVRLVERRLVTLIYDETEDVLRSA